MIRDLIYTIFFLLVIVFGACLFLEQKNIYNEIEQTNKSLMYFQKNQTQTNDFLIKAVTQQGDEIDELIYKTGELNKPH